MLRVIGMKSAVTLPRTLPFSFFPLSLHLTYLFVSLHVSETHNKSARAATTCSRTKKKIKNAARSVRNPDFQGPWKFVPQKCYTVVQFSASEEE